MKGFLAFSKRRKEYEKNLADSCSAVVAVSCAKETRVATVDPSPALRGEAAAGKLSRLIPEG
jgi:hypothetical protein